MPANPLSDPNFAANLTATIDKYVGMVRDNATLRVVKVVRLAVFGLLAAITGFVALILTVILGTRLFQKVSGRVFRVDHPTTVWISYLVLGGLMVVGGALLMRSRHTHES